MKLSHFIFTGILVSALSACLTDAHHYTQNVQKIVSAVNTKYPTVANTLVFIDAPEGYIARHFDNAAVEDSVDTGKVVAIIKIARNVAFRRINKNQRVCNCGIFSIDRANNLLRVLRIVVCIGHTGRQCAYQNAS